MTTEAHDAGGGFGRAAGANAARGVMVIVAAVIVGVLLDGDGASPNTAGASEAPDSDAAATGDSADDSTAETVPDGGTTTPSAALPAPRDPSEVSVLVLNGTNGLPGVAKRGTDVLKIKNYLTKDPKDAVVDGASVVLFQPGYESEAVAVATAFGVDPALVVKPFDAAASPIPDTQGANIIVRIGADGLIKV